jgi:FkbM family methyltransferase
MSIITKDCKHGKFSYFTNDTIIGKSLSVYGEYCEHEFMVLDQLIEPDWNVVDVGANIGLHSVWFSKHAFKGKVTAFEPNEYSRQLLLKNLTQNNCKNVDIYSNLVGNKIGTEFISSFDPSKPGNYGECSILDRDPNQLYEAKAMVKLDSLDLGAVDFIKIDVEGYEKEVMLGAENTIIEYRPGLLVEVNNSQTHVEHIWNQLAYLNYEIYWLPVRNYNPYNYFGNTVNVFSNSGIINVLALPKEKSNLHVFDSVLEPVEGYDDTYQKMYARVIAKLTS